MALIHCKFHSETLKLACSMDVILPQTTQSQVGMKGLATHRRAGHPVLWLLHGYSDDHTIWQRRTSIERYVASLGLAVVMPAVEHSFYTDMEYGLPYFKYMTEELPAICQSFFGLSARCEDNFVAGLSMGGYGAFKMALGCPEKYAAAASLSGAIDMAARVGGPDYKGDRKTELEWIFGDLHKVKGSQHDLLAVAKKVHRSRGPKPALWACCGTEDFLLEGNRSFRDHAAKIGYPLVYEESAGTHEWGFWDANIQRVLDWLPLPGKKAAAKAAKGAAKKAGATKAAKK